MNDNNIRYTEFISTEIFTRRKFSPISPSVLVDKMFITQFFCPVLVFSTVYIEDMATFAAIGEIYSTEYFSTTKVAGLGETFGMTLCSCWVNWEGYYRCLQNSIML